VRALRVLLAEDNLVNQRLATAILTREGHEVTLASNGQEALDAWAENPFDLVLMDVQMPEMDGLEASRQIRLREQDTGAHIPIIAMTAHAMTGDRERCLAAGMDEYLSKPIRIRQLADKLAMVLAPSSPHADEKSKPVESSTEVSPVDEELIDWEEAMEGVQGDHEIFRQIVQVFFEESEQLMRELEECSARGDTAGIKRAAHSLKGAVLCIAAQPSVEIAVQIEECASHGDLSAVQSHISTMQKHLVCIRSSLARYLREGKSE
jgi:two-component system, sensor histidine kinase and response regulator